MSGSARKDATKSANESAIVSHLARMAKVRKLRYQRKYPAGLGGVLLPRWNENDDAQQRRKDDRNEPGHDQRDATTANSENVYSPAELAAKPTGTKPAIVTSVPASMANA